MPYVIQRTDTRRGLWLARPGGQHAYTSFFNCARVFATREEADKERCPENEQVRSVDEVMRS